MALLFFEGFETVGTLTGLANQATTRPRINLRWGAAGVAGTPATQSYFTIDDKDAEGYALCWSVAAGTEASNYLQYTIPAAYRGIDASAEDFWVGMWIHVRDTVDTYQIMAARYAAGGNHFGVHVRDSTDLRVTIPPLGTQIALAEDVFTPGTWHHVAIRFKVGEVAFGEVEAWVDGVQVFNEASVDTRDFYGDVTYIRFTGSDGSAAADDYSGMDQIYILVESGADPAERLGTEVKVISLPPNADSTVEWSPSAGGDHYALVDENGADSADYVETDVDGEVEMFDITNLPDSGVYYGVKIEVEAIDTAMGANNMDVRIDSGGTVSETNYNVTSTVNYAVFTHYEGADDPDTAAAWTTSGINSLLVGAQFNT